MATLNIIKTEFEKYLTRKWSTFNCRLFSNELLQQILKLLVGNLINVTVRSVNTKQYLSFVIQKKIIRFSVCVCLNFDLRTTPKYLSILLPSDHRSICL